MNIDVSDDIILDEHKLYEVYVQLNAFRNKHRLNYKTFSKIMISQHVSSRNKANFKALFEITSNLIKFKKNIKVVSTKSSEDEVLLDDLNDVLSCRAVIIIENEHQDLDFIFTCIDAAEYGPNLNKYYNKMWQARGAGGCGDIPKLISKCFDEQVCISRLLVVNDSDKYNNDYDIPVAQQNIINRAVEKKSAHVMLRKREIENYIPIRVLENMFDPKYPKIEYFKSWNKEQRDYFDMKKGFQKNCRYDDAKYSNIYHGIPNTHLDAFFKSGFGEEIAKIAFNQEKRKLYTKQNLDIEDPEIYPEFCDIKDKLLAIL
ncbi:hypothetical protein L2719_07580 [Shewanella schlegeliana]|uniref:Uncharacterized protein n=1 Tax=Shewanella schlegeliana TaxID=190308 RepID=A0ABS1T2L9_9GAMM|nr:hypothetical protein [Shewanella schlegeliana]MBL4914374.1 hypothetical protein [Shewanella schlegeliana]MCL1109402.1 hypothetical protein [Shewanella schlegeliana]GIU31934.1 hypothetical protein TUM4433_24250 [Shewanella schlegeliana]